MKGALIIVKIGGKILENFENLKNTINQFRALISQNKIQRIVIIPGEGSYANFIRKIDAELNIGDDLAHWMAVMAMDQNGIALSQQYHEIMCFKEFEAFKKSNNPISVFLPYQFLHHTDQLPHTWDVTSDSITLYIANQLRLEYCYLIKNVDGIRTIENKVIREISTHRYKELKNSNKLITIKPNNNELKHSKPIDRYLTKLVDKYKIYCIILNGNSKTKRIIDFFDETINDREKIYSKIISST